jgi:hypothetical protein
VSDFTDSWTPETWRKALRASEDIIFKNVITITRLIAEIERLSAMVPNTAKATGRRSVLSQEKANLARLMREQGMTVPKIAEAIDRTPRHTQRLLKG